MSIAEKQQIISANNVTLSSNNTTIAENEQRVYEAGKKAEYDEWWDLYQSKGAKTYYPYAFAGNGWNNHTFKPKYDIKIVGSASGVFRQTGYLTLKDILSKCGVELDTSKADNLQYTFAYGTITNVPRLDCTNMSKLEGTFRDAKSLTLIEELVVTEQLTYTSPFYNCVKLKDITITGVIGNNFPIEYSPLTKESFTSIINALSPTATGKVVTFNKAAKEAAFTDEEWTALVATKPNWTISLAEV